MKKRWEFFVKLGIESMNAVRVFSGEDYKAAVVLLNARLLLSGFEARSQHYEIKIEIMV